MVLEEVLLAVTREEINHTIHKKHKKKIQEEKVKRGGGEILADFEGNFEDKTLAPIIQGMIVPM